MAALIHSEKIYPKRIGIMNNNSLVLQYYHLAKDKFKKHVIPFNPSSQPNAILEEILKNPKHAPYFKKVDPKHILSTLEGKNQYSSHLEEKRENHYVQFENNQHFEQENEQINKKNNEASLIKPQDSKLAFQSNRKEEIIEKKKKTQENQYYDDQFQEFEVSQSFDKTNQLPSHSISNISKPNISEVSVSAEIQLKTNKIKKEKKIAEVIEEIDNDFQFIDEEKKKKSKKKSKSKSKDKKSKKEKSKDVLNANDSKTVEEEFQFL